MNDVSDDDFFDESDVAENDDVKPRIIAASKEYHSIMGQLSVAADLVKDLTAKANKIKTDKMPQLLREFGSDIWRDEDTGDTVELKVSVGTLPKDKDKRNESLNTLRKIGIEEVMTEEFNVAFIPNDKRSPIVRALLGLGDPDFSVIEDDEDDAPKPSLSNSQMDLIQKFREDIGWAEEDLPADQKLGVHGSRFKSFVTKAVEAGKGDAVKEAGIWHGKIANMKVAKK